MQFRLGDKVRWTEKTIRGMNNLGSSDDRDRPTHLLTGIATVIFNNDSDISVRLHDGRTSSHWTAANFELAESRYKRNLPDWF